MHTRETWVQAIFPRPGRLGANGFGSGGTAQEIQTQGDLPYPPWGLGQAYVRRTLTLAAYHPARYTPIISASLGLVSWGLKSSDCDQHRPPGRYKARIATRPSAGILP